MGTPITNLKGIVNTAVAENIDIQTTQDAKQVVLDAVVEAQTIVDNGVVTITDHTEAKKVELTDYTNLSKNELLTYKDTMQIEFSTYIENDVALYDANAVNRINQYDNNHTNKLAEYNNNNTIKLNEYNYNHVERLEDLNEAYAKRIVEMINTKNILGVIDEYVVLTTTKNATFLSTVGNHQYYVNGVKLEEGIDYSITNSTTIQLATPVNPSDVVVQIATDLLMQLLIGEGQLTWSVVGVPDGVAGLDHTGKVPSTQLPSYVDDVIEVATYESLPITGETGKIYVVVSDGTSGNNTSTYRWTGTVYAKISDTMTAADIKSLYESNLNTNVYTDAEKVFVGVLTALTTTAQTLPTAINELQEHVLNDGSDHTFIDQDVTTTGTPRFNSIQLNGGTGTQGLVSWNPDEETLDVVLDGAILQVGQEFIVNVRNDTAITIANGTPVMLTSTLGNSGRVLVKPMDGTVQSNSMRVVGVTTVEIGAGLDGKATILGKIRDMDTTGASVGETWQNNDVLYVHPTQIGKFTKVAPTSSQIDMPIAIVVNAHTSGTLFVRVLPYNRNELSPAITANYYDKTAIDILLASQNDASEIVVTPQGNLSAETVQLALEELQGKIDTLTVVEEW